MMHAHLQAADVGCGVWNVGRAASSDVARTRSNSKPRAWMILIATGEETVEFSTMSTTDGTGHCSEHGFQPSQLSDSNYIQANKLSTQPPDGQLPEVSHVDLADAVSQEQAVGEIIESIKLSGACIVRNMVSTKALDEIERDIRPHLDTASVWKGMLCLVSCLSSVMIILHFSQ